MSRKHFAETNVVRNFKFGTKFIYKLTRHCEMKLTEY